MKLEGGCYCGALKYHAEGQPVLKGQCHCRECQYHSGGGPNYFMLMPGDGFQYVAGTPKQFRRSDLADPVTREFCADCGTHILTRRSDRTEVVLKIGTLDDPAMFEAPQMAIFTVNLQPFHLIPDGLPAFRHLPAPRG